MPKVFIVTDQELAIYARKQQADLLTMLVVEQQNNPELSTENLLVLAQQKLQEYSGAESIDLVPEEPENNSLAIDPVDQDVVADEPGVSFNDRNDERLVSDEDVAFEVVEEQPLYDSSVEEVAPEDEIVEIPEPETEPNDVDSIDENNVVDETQPVEETDSLAGRRRVYRGLFSEAADLDKI